MESPTLTEDNVWSNPFSLAIFPVLRGRRCLDVFYLFCFLLRPLPLPIQRAPPRGEPFVFVMTSFLTSVVRLEIIFF